MTEKMIDFSVGMSDPASFPIDDLAEAAARAVRNVGTKFAFYPGPYGHAGLRRVMAERESTREGAAYDPDHFSITNGSMQAVTLAGQALMKAPGDVIVAEENTYSATINAYKGIGAELVGVPVDHEGMQVELLDEVLGQLAAEGRRPAFVYTIPTYQNPTAAVMPLARRELLIETARRHGVTIVEDNCYADVRYEGDVPPTLYTLTGGDGVVYLGSLSKIFAAGVRLGYLVAQPELLAQIVSRRYDNGPSTLAASVVAEYLEGNMWEHIERQNTALRAKRDALVEALREEAPEGCSWLDPVGGMFLWLHLPDGVEAKRLQEIGQEHAVGFALGSNFHIHHTPIPYIRLAFAHPTPEQVREGALRLCRSIRAAMPAAANA